MSKKTFLLIFLFFVESLSNEKLFVIIIPSYNNSRWYKQNLDSILNQNYNNFRVIYIDDHSPDGTGKLVEKYLKQKDIKKKVKLIQNIARKKAFANLYYAIHSCDPREIVVTVDGDDFLKDNNVLKYLNQIYQDKNIWLTYGQFEYQSKKCQSYAQPYPIDVIKSNNFRNHKFYATHLRTFYAWLFQSITKEDLMFNNEFFPMAWDVAMMIPMLEMCGKNHKFISKVLYIYNDNNPINDYRINKILQDSLKMIIFKKNKYLKLEEPKFKSIN